MVRSHVMTARRRAALRRAQLASARKRRRGKRIDRKINRVNRRADKKIRKAGVKFERGLYTHSQQGGLYATGSAVKAYSKGVRIQNKRMKKVNALKAKKRKR